MNERAITISVGQPSPLESPGPGQMALAATIVSGVLTMVLQLPDVSDEDIANVTGIPHALALLQSTDLPIGVLMLALRTGDGAFWPLMAPVVSHVDVMRAWAADKQDGNIVLVLLVDSNTNIVKSLRTIGAPLDLFDLIQSGIQSCQHFDPAEFVMRASELSPEEVWGQGRRWLRDDESDEFRVAA